MTAMNAGDRRLTAKWGDGLVTFKFDLPVKGGDFINAGSLVVLNSDGTLSPGSTATGLVAMGRADFQVDNTASLSPAPLCRVTTGVFSWVNHSNEFDDGDIGSVAYVADDQTVTNSSSGTSPAGIFMGLDDDGQAKVAMSPLLARLMIDNT